jgi:hypothetical protein
MLTTDLAERAIRGRRRIAALAFGCAMAAVLATDAVAAPACIRADERAALAVRAVQTDLMVAALSCNFRPAYNEFVLRFRPALDRHTEIVHRYFRRAYGSHATSEATRYFTRFANRTSLEGVADLDRFCDRSAAVLSSVRNVAPRGLDAFARTQDAALRAEHDFDACDLAKN